jgi:hypothetical protein
VGLFDRLAPHRLDMPPPPPPRAAATPDDSVFVTKALGKFLTAMTATERPVLMDMGPVVGSNVNFLGEQVGCKLFVEDVLVDVDNHVRDGKVDALPEFLERRIPHGDSTFDGILCWNVFDYLERAAARVLVGHLTRVLRPHGMLLGFFRTLHLPEHRYAKYLIIDQCNVKYRSYAAAGGCQTVHQNRDIMQLFGGLRVSESFLLKNNFREVLFRKPF